MGCDIHIMVERRDLSNSSWAAVEQDEGDGGNRNYDVFNVLAGVRADTAEEMAHWPNDDGKFNSKWCFSGRERRPISEPRGLPDDVSDEVREFIERCGDHSTSHVTATEVLYYPWDTPAGSSGWINATQWVALRAGQNPTEWSQGIGGGGIINLTAAEMDKAVDGGIADTEQGARTYARATWPCKFRGERFVRWIEDQVKAAQTEDPRRGADDVRFVFSFDN